MIRCVFAPASLAIAILIASATNMKPAANASAPPAERKPNRLAGESSPYLLQHAYNPVNWYAWGDEAFRAAREADKPIFLSIGYSTCYWCHVMERECFEDETIATVMNDLFICIKVDREQRPDVDDLYMTGVQLMTGSGGWPMSMFLEPATLKPFYGGTYFPPEDRYGRPGFNAVLRGVADAWKNNRAAVMEQASRIAQAIAAQHTIDVRPIAFDQSHVDQAVAGLMSVYDLIDGGFSGVNQRAPKFPQPANVDMLIAVAWDQAPVRKAVLHTLDRMAMGGMYDQIGGGFHRYSVDEKWRVPHFEKMLYDNAQLVSTYARTYELTGDAYYAQIVRDTLQYVLREMTSPQGAFYSAQDAEVNAMEGGNYVWTKDQIKSALIERGGEGLVDFALKVFGVDQGPNFQDPHRPDAGNVNVLFLPQRPDQMAEAMRLDAATFEAQLNRVRGVLREKRARRDQPSTDDKILAGWNGLMIAAFADGGRLLKRAEMIGAASKAADFVLARMRSEDGGLLRFYRDGKAGIDAFLEDYAFMIRGLIALHRATSDKRWLDEAIRLTHAANARFKDSTRGGGGWFDTRENQGELFVRIKNVHDGAVPSGNSVMLLNLLELFEITGERRWFDEAKAALGGLSSAVSQHPAGSVISMVALHRLGAIEGNSPDPVGNEPVAVSVNLATIDWNSREQFEVEVRLDIAPKWHVSAASPGVDWAVPFKIEMIDCEGLSATPNYPDGEEFLVGGMPAMRVMSGRVSIPVSIKRTAGVVGTPRLAVSYQACDDRSCRAPQRVIIRLSE